MSAKPKLGTSIVHLTQKLTQGVTMAHRGGLPHEKESELWGPMTSGSSVSLESPITGCGASIPQNFAVRAISQSRKDCRKDRYHIGNKSRSPSLQVQQGWLVHSRGIPTKRGDYPKDLFWNFEP